MDLLLKERLRQLGAKGGKQTAKGLSKQERSDKARKAAAARWGKKPAPKAAAASKAYIEGGDNPAGSTARGPGTKKYGGKEKGR